MKKHKAECHSKPCDQCDFKANNLQEMKRHMRDSHAVHTESTSPPNKKKRKQEKEQKGRQTDTDNDDNVSVLSAQLEDMDIDDEENDVKDEYSRRSELMDKKILDKERRLMEEARKNESIKNQIKSTKIARKQVDMESVKKLKKSMKQKSKDAKKRMNKRKQVVTEVENEMVFKVPNLKEVPVSCRHLVNEGDLVYIVPGDGACLPNCGAAFFCQDEVFGTKLRKKMNRFFVKHYYRRFQNLCPVSKKNPFSRKTRDGSVTYTDVKELFKYLLDSKDDTLYMWSEGVDLNVIADMYQVTIKVITTGRTSGDKKPTVNYVYPDESMKEYAELKNVEINEMVLLHEEDMHFNLVVSKDSDLAKLGSLSFRFNVGPLINDDFEIPEDPAQEEKVLDDDTGKGENALEVKRELKKYKEENKKLREDYLKCVNELKKSTEENIILKAEVKDLKQFVELENEVASEVIDVEDSVKKTNKEGEVLFKFKKSGFTRENPQNESTTNKSKSKDQEIQYNCFKCAFQGTKETELKKHISLKHVIEEKTVDHSDQIKCRNCGDVFTTKWNLMNHRKNEHLNIVAQCRNYLEGKCVYTDSMCWWKHAEREVSSETNITCFICNKNFVSKPLMMSHRKRDHADVLRPCRNYLNNECKYQDDSCWFVHGHEKVDNNGAHNPTNIEEDVETELGFQEASKNRKPPLKNNQKPQKL